MTIFQHLLSQLIPSGVHNNNARLLSQSHTYSSSANAELYYISYILQYVDQLLLFHPKSVSETISESLKS